MIGVLSGKFEKPLKKNKKKLKKVLTNSKSNDIINT